MGNIIKEGQRKNSTWRTEDNDLRIELRGSDNVQSSTGIEWLHAACCRKDGQLEHPPLSALVQTNSTFGGECTVALYKNQLAV